MFQVGVLGPPVFSGGPNIGNHCAPKTTVSAGPWERRRSRRQGYAITEMGAFKMNFSAVSLLGKSCGRDAARSQGFISFASYLEYSLI
jgi:hypothetical protein